MPPLPVHAGLLRAGAHAAALGSDAVGGSGPIGRPSGVALVATRKKARPDGTSKGSFRTLMDHLVFRSKDLLEEAGGQCQHRFELFQEPTAKQRPALKRRGIRFR